MVEEELYMIWASTLLLPITYGLFRAYQNTKNVSIKYIEVPKKNSSSQAPLQILHISDMHLENISISPTQLYERVKHEKIDLIALTGDFLDRYKTIPKLIPYLEMLQKLNPTYGIYSVFGNHDYVLKGEKFEHLKETLEAYHCHPLQNETVTIEHLGQKINIIGIDDYSTNRSDFKKSYQNVGAGYQLVLTHDPNAVLHMKNYSFDYLLSGHFHGGQILYPKAYHLAKMGELPKMNMIKGLQQYNGKTFYISEGLGQTGVNIRIGSRPEITIHKLFTEASEELKGA